MNKLRAIFIIGLLCFLLPAKNSFAQAEVVKDGDNYTFVYYEKVKKGNGNGCYLRWETTNYNSKSTISPSGNIVKTLYYQLQDDHPLTGQTMVFGARIKVDDDVYLIDEMVDLKKDGSFQVNIHLNGAGARLPVGWQ
ncbi:MAG TPA: hypothetical protein VEP89_09855 [Draconibacterium sp.]|nr:hypothetical protein [Draconibacterium sp.]